MPLWLSFDLTTLFLPLFRPFTPPLILPLNSPLKSLSFLPPLILPLYFFLLFHPFTCLLIFTHLNLIHLPCFSFLYPILNFYFILPSLYTNTSRPPYFIPLVHPLNSPFILPYILPFLHLLISNPYFTL